MTQRSNVCYKLVELPDGRRGLATMSIPKTSTVVDTSYKVAFRGKSDDSESPIMSRVDDIITMSITPIGSSSIVLRGKSIRGDNKLDYIVGQHTKCVSFQPMGGRGNGIHVFWDPNTPLLWDKMFGK